jgi:Ca2+-binding EF-hand superfamily protein
MKLRILSLAIAACILTPTHAAEFPGASLLVDLLMKFDTNSDDKLDAGEWEKGIVEGFDEMDMNGDGKITSEELAKLKGPITEEHGTVAGLILPPLIDKLVMTQDTNKDGAVSREEYKSTSTKLWTALDADKDGLLTRAELLELPNRVLAGLK